MRQLQLFTTTELARMRDRTASRRYSPARDQFRSEHKRHRDWGLMQRHGRRLAHLRRSAAARVPHEPAFRDNRFDQLTEPSHPIPIDHPPAAADHPPVVDHPPAANTGKPSERRPATRTVRVAPYGRRHTLSGGRHDTHSTTTKRLVCIGSCGPLKKFRNKLPNRAPPLAGT